MVRFSAPDRSVCPVAAVLPVGRDRLCGEEHEDTSSMRSTPRPRRSRSRRRPFGHYDLQHLQRGVQSIRSLRLLHGLASSPSSPRELGTARRRSRRSPTPGYPRSNRRRQDRERRPASVPSDRFPTPIQRVVSLSATTCSPPIFSYHQCSVGGPPTHSLLRLHDSANI